MHTGKFHPGFTTDLELVERYFLLAQFAAQRGHREMIELEVDITLELRRRAEIAGAFGDQFQCRFIRLAVNINRQPAKAG